MGRRLDQIRARLGRTPPLKLAVVAALLGLFVGVGALTVASVGLAKTNTEPFCISCHEMRDTVYAEYKGTIHDSNRSGVRAACPDCHVPHELGPKLIRKMEASTELWGSMTGKIGTKEKFEKHRYEMARREWTKMKETDSRECRNCHKFDFMDYTLQEPRASKTHQEALTAGKTCIDCHRGIAHKLPPNANEEYKKLTESMEADSHKSLAQYLMGLVAPSANAEPAKK